MPGAVWRIPGAVWGIPPSVLGVGEVWSVGSLTVSESDPFFRVAASALDWSLPGELSSVTVLAALAAAALASASNSDSKVGGGFGSRTSMRCSRSRLTVASDTPSGPTASVSVGCLGTLRLCGIRLVDFLGCPEIVLIPWVALDQLFSCLSSQ